MPTATHTPPRSVRLGVFTIFLVIDLIIVFRLKEAIESGFGREDRVEPITHLGRLFRMAESNLAVAVAWRLVEETERPT